MSGASPSSASASGPAPASRQGRAYRPEQVEELFRGALADLMADGTAFRDLSVERLVGATGMARSTFYVLFDDKTAMLEVLSAAALKRLYLAQRSWLSRGRDVTREDVRASMRALLDAYLADEVVLRAVGEASGYDPRIRDAYVAGVKDYARAIERFIRAGQKEGWVADGHPADTAAALAWMTERTVQQTAMGAGPRRLDSIAETLAGVVCATLLPGGAGADRGEETGATAS